MQVCEDQRRHFSFLSEEVTKLAKQGFHFHTLTGTHTVDDLHADVDLHSCGGQENCCINFSELFMVLITMSSSTVAILIGDLWHQPYAICHDLACI